MKVPFIRGLVHGYGLRGMADQALELFKRTPSQFIDDITYLCVLNACSHSGFVDKAQQIFESIPNRTNKIYTAMVTYIYIYIYAYMYLNKFIHLD